MSTFHSTGNDTEKVTKNLDPNNAKGHDMIDIRKYLQNLFFILSHMQQFYF